ncbi:hypothetical protein GCM10007973_05100 [Polymorphobacter multimanifer]|uniref:Uncharacterized protein n=1 Tax=Polymorphobacter multimanifer TaxID=1070431 RepID=A0A841L4T8_9SPHN|nr:hypothetical protein [Polymorphobacter multimanifer]MBB6227657.1 hypothetical protein [Polymorphobacter multimanifer]GGI71087.1 hypothetical protein GCM10007973_05100 [Polymorphobacter multimanifer]
MADGAQIFRTALAKILAGGGDSGEARKAFRLKVDSVAKRDGCAAHEAMRKVRIEHPELYDALQNGSPASINAVEQPAPGLTEARAAFASKAREIAKRDGLPGHVAMSRTRVEHPELFAALR